MPRSFKPPKPASTFTPTSIAIPTVHKTQEAPPPPVGASGGVVGGVPGGVVGGIPDGVLSEVLSSTRSVPAPAKMPDPTPVKRIRVASRVVEANLIHDVTPQYPPEAGRARIEGPVVLMAVIGTGWPREGCASRERFTNPRASRNRCGEAMALQAIHDRRRTG